MKQECVSGMSAMLGRSTGTGPSLLGPRSQGAEVRDAFLCVDADFICFLCFQEVLTFAVF